MGWEVHYKMHLLLLMCYFKLLQMKPVMTFCSKMQLRMLFLSVKMKG